MIRYLQLLAIVYPVLNFKHRTNPTCCQRTQIWAIAHIQSITKEKEGDNI